MLSRAIVGAVVLFATALPVCAQETKLQWKFKEGETFFVEDVVTTKYTVTAQGLAVNQDSEEKLTTLTSYKVQKVTGDSIVLVMTIEDVETKGGGGLTGTGKIMEKVKGAVFTVTITPGGKVTKFEGFESLAKQLGDGDEDVAKMLKAIITEEMFRQPLENSFGFMPDKAVKKGDTWTKDSVYPLGPLGEFKTASTYTYKGPGDGGESIGMKQSLTYAFKKGAEIAGLFKIVKGNLKANKAHGVFVFDADKGRMASASVSMQMNGSLTMDINGQQQIQIDLSIDTVANSRVFDKRPERN
jgi:hypothetical protein